MPGRNAARAAEFPFADDLGPARVMHLYEPALDLRAVLVIDNVARGPAIGGVRMGTQVSTEEAFRLARAMTLKNSAAGLRHGGGKSVIFADPSMPLDQKEQVIRAFARMIERDVDYIPGPDMGTNEQAMAWVHDEIGRAAGLPAALGGIPLDEIGATGFGVRAAVDVAAEHLGIPIEGARVAVQGFGAVGRHAARFLAERGAILVAAADSRGMTANPAGLDIEALSAHKVGGAGVAQFEGGTAGEADAIIDVECEIWIPAAQPDVIHAGNVDRLQARIVAQGANIPATAEAEARLHKRGVLVIPDFIANAGGVISAAVEYRGGTETEAFLTIDECIRDNTAEVLRDATEANITPRAAALALAERRVREAMTYRRWS
jgi:glutamate dehydrogenase (NAD(P)+)